MAHLDSLASTEEVIEARRLGFQARKGLLAGDNPFLPELMALPTSLIAVPLPESATWGDIRCHDIMISSCGKFIAVVVSGVQHFAPTSSVPDLELQEIRIYETAGMLFRSAISCDRRFPIMHWAPGHPHLSFSNLALFDEEGRSCSRDSSDTQIIDAESKKKPQHLSTSTLVASRAFALCGLPETEFDDVMLSWSACGRYLMLVHQRDGSGVISIFDVVTDAAVVEADFEYDGDHASPLFDWVPSGMGIVVGSGVRLADASVFAEKMVAVGHLPDPCMISSSAGMGFFLMRANSTWPTCLCRRRTMAKRPFQIGFIVCKCSATRCPQASFFLFSLASSLLWYRSCTGSPALGRLSAGYMTVPHRLSMRSQRA